MNQSRSSTRSDDRVFFVRLQGKFSCSRCHNASAAVRVLVSNERNQVVYTANSCLSCITPMDKDLLMRNGYTTESDLPKFAPVPRRQPVMNIKQRQPQNIRGRQSSYQPNRQSTRISRSAQQLLPSQLAYYGGAAPDQLSKAA